MVQNLTGSADTGFDAFFQGTDGDLYAPTYGGGTNSDRTIYSLSLGLGPFVETVPASGKVGTRVKTLGTNLTGTTGVSFNGTAAVFKSWTMQSRKPACVTGRVGLHPGWHRGIYTLGGDMSRPGLLLPVVGFFVSGLVGVVPLYPLLGSTLRTLRAGVGFGLGFLVMSAVLLFTLLPIQGMSRSPFLPVVFFLVGFTIAFAVAGVIGGAILGLGGEMFLRSAASFAAGGASGGILLAAVFAVSLQAGSLGIGWTRGKVVALALAMACFLLSYAVGGALFARALAKCQADTANLAVGRQ